MTPTRRTTPATSVTIVQALGDIDTPEILRFISSKSRSLLKQTRAILSNAFYQPAAPARVSLLALRAGKNYRVLTFGIRSFGALLPGSRPGSGLYWKGGTTSAGVADGELATPFSSPVGTNST